MLTGLWRKAPTSGPEVRCAVDCDGCFTAKHPCGGPGCNGQGCCACGGMTSLAVHRDADEGGCYDPPAQKATAGTRQE